MNKEKWIRNLRWENRNKMLLEQESTGLSRHGKFVKVACPACGLKKTTVAFIKDSFTFVTCVYCGTMYVNPRPDEKILRWYYSTSQWSKDFAKMVRASEKGRKKLLYTPRAKLVSACIHKYLPFSKEISLLEIGAGTGAFLETLRGIESKWDYTTLEPSKKGASYLRQRGFNVIEKNLEELMPHGTICVDVVLNFELIEHIFNPFRFLKKVHSIMKRNGLLILSTPNYYGFDFLAIGKDYKGIIGPNHLNYFNTESMRLLLKRSGFGVLELTTPGILDVERVCEYFRRTKNSGNEFLNFLLYKTNVKTLRDFQLFLQNNRLSGHMLVVSQKL